jgi:hypothetical protein
MTSHPWTSRILVLVLLAAAYAIGYAGGRDQTLLRYTQHPACNINLRP